MHDAGLLPQKSAVGSQESIPLRTTQSGPSMDAAAAGQEADEQSLSGGEGESAPKLILLRLNGLFASYPQRAWQ